MKILTTILLLLLPVSALAKTQAVPYQITAQQYDRSVTMVGEVNEVSAQYFKARLNWNQDKEIVVFISSYGGYFNSFLDIREAMRKKRARGHKLQCVVLYRAISSAAMMLGYCDSVVGLASTKIMIHPPAMPDSFNALRPDMRNAAKYLRNMTQSYYICLDYIIDSMPLPYSLIKTYYDNETYFTLAELDRHSKDPDWALVVPYIIINN